MSSTTDNRRQDAALLNICRWNTPPGLPSPCRPIASDTRLFRLCLCLTAKSHRRCAPARPVSEFVGRVLYMPTVRRTPHDRQLASKSLSLHGSECRQFFRQPPRDLFSNASEHSAKQDAFTFFECQGHNGL